MKRTRMVWALADGDLVLARRKGRDELVATPKRGLPSGAYVFDSEADANGEIRFLRTRGAWPLCTFKAAAYVVA
jgi:hypothetical protein